MLVDHVYDPLSKIFLDLGIITWQKYSFMIMLGIVVAVLLGLREGKKLGINSDKIIDGVLIIVPLSIIGARLWYVVFEWKNQFLEVFQDSGLIAGIINVFNISGGGLAIHGGFFVAFISAYIYTKWKKISIFATFDLMAPGFLIAQAAGRWGNFFNQEAHGGVIGGVNSLGKPLLDLDAQRAFLSETLHLPNFITNQMYLYGPVTPGASQTLNYFHPTFFYESVWNVAGFIIMLILRRTKLIRQGDLLVIYLIWYSAGRFFIEGMRTDSLFIGNTGLRTAQITSLLMIAGGIALAILTRTVFNQPKYFEVLESIKKQNAEQI